MFQKDLMQGIPSKARVLMADIDAKIESIAQHTAGGIDKCEFDVRQTARIYVPDAVKAYLARIDAEGDLPHDAAVGALIETLGRLDAAMTAEQKRVADLAGDDQRAYGRFVGMRFPYDPVKPEDVKPLPAPPRRPPPAPPEVRRMDPVIEPERVEDADSGEITSNQVLTGVGVLMGFGVLLGAVLSFVGSGKPEPIAMTASDKAFVGYCQQGGGAMQRVKHLVVRPRSAYAAAPDPDYSDFYPTCVGGAHAGYVERDGTGTTVIDPLVAAAHLNLQKKCVDEHGTYEVKDDVAPPRTKGADPDMVALGVPYCDGGYSNGARDKDLVWEQKDVTNTTEMQNSEAIGVLPRDFFEAPQPIYDRYRRSY